jgi:hypothetical protein
MMPAPRGPLTAKQHAAKPKPSAAASGHMSTGGRAAKEKPSGHVSTKRRPEKAKPSTVTKPSTGEVVPVLLSKHELRPVINKARKYGRDFEQAGKLLAVELHRLQEAEAHLTYRRESFGAWAATEFADLGLTSTNANKLSQQGRMTLLLQRKGRVKLEDPGTFPGTTGARALTGVMAKHGEDAMLQVFDACPPDSITLKTVNATASALLPPPPAKAAPPGAIDHEDDDEEPEEIPPKVQALRDHIERLHDYLHDISCADDADPVAVARAYEHLLEDTQALRPVLDAVLPGQDDAPIALEREQ